MKLSLVSALPYSSSRVFQHYEKSAAKGGVVAKPLHDKQNKTKQTSNHS
jgi:hypothetical protein